MNGRRKRIAVIAVIAALAAFGGGVAYATTSANDRQEALLRDAAGRLNVSPDELRSALEGAFGDQLDQAVKDGKLTQEQADRIKQETREHGLPLLGGPGGPDGPHAFVAGPIGPGIDAAADYLGISRAELGKRLEKGDTLAEVAKAEGKSVDGLEQALVDAAKADLDRAVADGKLTDAQRDEMLKDLQEHVADLVAGKGFGMHKGPGGPGGPPPLGGDFHERGSAESGTRPGAFDAPAPPPVGAWN